MSMIIPAILEKTREKFEEKISVITKIPGVEKIQVDFADGIFVPNLTLPAHQIELLSPAFEWEAHLMVDEPKDFFDYEICGFKTAIVHYEAYKSPGDLLTAMESIKNLGLEPGICLKNETPVEVLKIFAGEVERFQLMGIVPGFQGQPFLENTYNRIKELRELIPGATIEVDGGANLLNVKKLSQAGADLIIAGSAIVGSGNPAQNFEKLQQEINKN